MANRLYVQVRALVAAPGEPSRPSRERLSPRGPTLALKTALTRRVRHLVRSGKAKRTPSPAVTRGGGARFSQGFVSVKNIPAFFAMLAASAENNRRAGQRSRKSVRAP